MIKSFTYKLWNSPTFTTWASLGTQSLGLLAVLPLVLTSLSENEIAVYYLFATVIGFQALFQLGFQPTFVRLIGYALAGCRVENMGDLVALKSSGVANTNERSQDSLEAICGSMRRINELLSLWTFILLGIVGTLLMVVPIGRLENTKGAWIGWVLIVFVSAIRVNRNGYDAYLLGANHVALSQRWQALFNVGKIISMILTLLVYPSLVAVILVNQVWILLSIIRSWQLSHWVSEGQFHQWSKQPFKDSVLKMVWSKSWRSGVGQVGGKVTQQSLGIVYAQFATGSAVASYLLALQLIDIVERFARAPFYSKLPLLNRLRAQGEECRLMDVARRGMLFSYITYLLGFGVLSTFGHSSLVIIDANVGFPSLLLWYLIGFAYFTQRFGANHIQLYSTTNRIIWHWANCIQGVVTIIASLYLGPRYGGVGFAASILLGSLCYTAYSVTFSYGIFKISRLRFESHAAIAPFCLLMLLALAEWLFSLSESVSLIAQRILS